MQKSWYSKTISIIKKAIKLPSFFLIILVSFYQKTFSPDHGFFTFSHPYGCCRYYPSCSQYAKEALGKYGFFKGAGLSLWRVLRCNPWSRGGIDQVK